MGPVGAGGMGDVYRARDTRLGREVAVEVLPAEVAADAERVRRFEFEARALAAVGRVDEVEAVVEESLTLPVRGFASAGTVMLEASEELRAHGYSTAAVRVAEERPIRRCHASYRRACIAAQRGDGERAIELLREAFARGMPFDQYLHRYAYLEPPQGYPPFEELIAPKG